MSLAQAKKLLPEVFQQSCTEGTPLLALLEAMSTLLNPAHDVLDNLERYFNPYSCPDEWVPYLAAWVDMEFLLEQTLLGRRVVATTLATGTGRMRELVAHAASLSRSRGTSAGLLAFLKLATGADDFTLIENPDGRLFHVDLVAPARLQPFTKLINAIVEREKPAYVTCDTTFAPPAAPTN